MKSNINNTYLNPPNIQPSTAPGTAATPEVATPEVLQTNYHQTQAYLQQQRLNYFFSQQHSALSSSQSQHQHSYISSSNRLHLGVKRSATEFADYILLVKYYIIF